MSRYPTWKVVALKQALEEIVALEDAGHEVLRYTDHHWRIDGIDVWPSSMKYRADGVMKEYEKLSDVVSPFNNAANIEV